MTVTVPPILHSMSMGWINTRDDLSRIVTGREGYTIPEIREALKQIYPPITSRKLWIGSLQPPKEEAS